MVKISSFIVSILILGIIATAFGNMFIEMNRNYAPQMSNDTMSKFNKYDDIAPTVEQTENDLNEITTGGDGGSLSVLDEIFEGGYTAVKTTSNSLSAFRDLSNDAFEEARIPKYISVALGLIVVILIIIGVIMSVVVKKDV